MGLFKKEPDFYHRQLAIWEKKAEEAVIGSDAYDDAMSNVATIHKYIKDSEEKKDYSGIETAIKGAGVLVTLGLGIANICLYKKTADLAYREENQLHPANGKVWNLKENFKVKP